MQQKGQIIAGEIKKGQKGGKSKGPRMQRRDANFETLPPINEEPGPDQAPVDEGQVDGEVCVGGLQLVPVAL